MLKTNKMEGRLIKLGLSEGYRLDDLNGNYIASTLNGKNKLSLRNCEEIELGFSLVELFDKVDSSIDYHEFDFCSFRLGVKAVLELLGDKKFSEEDIKKAIAFGWDYEGRSKEEMLEIYNINLEYNNSYFEDTQKYIQSLQQTEWDVEIEMEDGTIVYPHGENEIISQPRLDKDGCLILKRK